MKKIRYSDEQIVRILRETDKDSVAEVAKRHGVSEQSIYGWRQRFSGMAADDRASRLIAARVAKTENLSGAIERRRI